MNNNKIIFFVSLILLMAVSGAEAQPDKKEKKKKETQQVQVPQGSSSAGVAMLIEAKKEEITGNPKKAIEIYREYIAKYPEGAVGYYELARLLSDEKQYDESQKMAAKAVELNPGNIWYQDFLAESYQLSGNYKEAISLYQKIIEKYPEKVDYYYHLSTLYLVTGRYREAIAVYDKLEEKIGISEEISVQKEKIFLQMNDISRARQELEDLVASDPENTRYLMILAEFLMSNEQREAAFEIYQKIAQLDPGNAYIHISLADYYRKAGNKTKAFDELKLGFSNPNLDIDTKIGILLNFYSANEVTPDFKEEAFNLARILVQTHPRDAKGHSIYADLLIQDEKYGEARNELMKVISYDSSKYLVWQQLLQLDIQMEKFDTLEIHSQAAMELFPDQPVPYLFSGMANYQLKNFSKAAKMLTKGSKLVVNQDELLFQFYMYLGDTYHALKNPEESDKAYEKSLQIRQDNAYVLNNYSYYLSIRNKDLKKAEEMAKKAVTLEPKNSSFQDTYGWVLYKLGKYTEAKEWIGKAIGDTAGVSAEVLEHYGDVLFKLDNPSDALEYWNKAKAKGQGSEFLEKKIADKKLYE
jgi:tetratricopeptide (TPR) repeat protein